MEQYTYLLLVTGYAEMRLSSAIAELTLLLMKLDTAWIKIATPLTFYLLWYKMNLKAIWKKEMQQDLHSAKC